MIPRFAALRSRNFRLLWIGFLISHTGTWMAIVGVGWLIYSVTGSPFYLGLNSLAFAVPMIVLPVFGGVIADRVDRLRMLKATQSGMLLSALALAVLVHTGHIILWAVIALNFLEGVFLAFDNPARQALIPDLVDPPALMSAVSLAGVTYQSAAFVGPALAGIILGAAGAERTYVLFYLNAVSFLAVLISLTQIRGVVYHVHGHAEGVWQSLHAGLAYVWATPVTRALITLAIISGLFARSASVLMPVFARDILDVGARGLGFLLAAPGAGTIVGSAVLAGLGTISRKGRYYVVGNLIFCTCLAAFTISRVFPVSLALLLVAGGFAATSGVVLVTMLQFNTPGHLRGRVLSLVTLAFIGVPSLGGMVVGSAATAIGTPQAIFAGAVIVATAMVALGARQLMRAA